MKSHAMIRGRDYIGVGCGEFILNGEKKLLLQETGVEIEITALLGICDHIIENEKSHWVSPSYLCKITQGNPSIMEPTKYLDMQWFSLDNLPANIMITTKNAIENYKK